MAVPIKVPSVGESISEGVLARWLKRDGERVRADEPVFELETEKATGEVPAPAAGVLRIKASEGATVAIGSVVGEIDAEVGSQKELGGRKSDVGGQKSEVGAQRPEVGKPKPDATRPVQGDGAA